MHGRKTLIAMLSHTRDLKKNPGLLIFKGTGKHSFIKKFAVQICNGISRKAKMKMRNAP
jgi:hypothetical protein